jgi:hypothetical protein
MTQQQKKFFEELKSDWREDPPLAVAYARLYWWLIPEEVIAESKRLYQSVNVHYDIESSVNTAMVSLGGSPSYGSPGVDPETLMFLGIMGQIRYHEGDPPMPPNLANRADEILLGRLDPLEAFMLAGAHIPGYGLLVRDMLPFLGDMSQLLRRIGVLFAALALPRARLPRMFDIPYEEEPHPDAAPEITDDLFERAIRAAQAAFASRDYARAEKEVVSALGTAIETPSPNDDIKALETLAVLAFRSRIAPETMKLGVEAVEALNERNTRLDKLAGIAYALTTLAPAYGLGEELDPRLAKLCRSLLGKSIPRDSRFPLLLCAAGALHRTGDDANASELLDDARKRSSDPSDRLDVALLDADVHWDNGDRDGAADLLVEALEHRSEIDAAKVSTAVQKLVCLWPGGRDGLGEWLDEMMRQADALEEPQKTFYLLTASIAHWRDGRYGTSAEIAKGLDLDMAEKLVPDPLKELVRQIHASVDAMNA